MHQQYNECVIKSDFSLINSGSKVGRPPCFKKKKVYRGINIIKLLKIANIWIIGFKGSSEERQGIHTNKEFYERLKF